MNNAQTIEKMNEMKLYGMAQELVPLLLRWE